MEEKILLNATVCLLIKDNEVLLGLKTDKIGAGCRNGYGGGIEQGESILDAAIRELEEETGRKIGNIFITTTPEFLEKVAIIDFENIKNDGTSFVCRVHFFIVKKWIGTPKDTNEMIDPQFFAIDNLPFSQMMPADIYYFPLILQGKKIKAKVKYGPYQKELLGPVFIEEVLSFTEN